MPFCSEAWDAISRYIYTGLEGGSIMKGWMKKENEMITCCSDGTRPVIFKIERIDYEGKEQQMNEIIKAMEERRSIRKFKPDMPAKKDLEQIIEAGLYAANGMGKQATITIAVTNKNFETDYQQSMQRQAVGKKDLIHFMEHRLF